MEDERIILAAFWVALMFLYLLGDVLRIFAGDFTPGEIDGKPMTQTMLMVMTLFMLIPISMILLTFFLPYSILRWVSIIAAAFLVLFNLAGLPYDSYFDNFLLIVGIGVNIITALYAWNWII